MFEKTDSKGVSEFYYDSISEWYSEINATWRGFKEGVRYLTPQLAYNASLANSSYAEQIKQIVSKLVSQVQMSMPDMQPGMDVTGLGYDVGLALSGVPECWLTTQVSKDPKVVRILYHTSVSSAVSSQQIIARGIAVCALVMCLEVAGINSEVVLVADSGFRQAKQYRSGLRYFITFKKSDDYFDLEKFSFAICDPSFRRMLGFSWNKTKALIPDSETHPACISTPSKTGFDMYFEKMWATEPEFQTLESTKQWVIAKCREFGVEISNPPLV